MPDELLAATPRPAAPGTTRSTLLRSLQLGEGNELAWEDFVYLYAPYLKSAARRHGLHDADAEDVAATALGNVYQGLPDFSRRGRGTFRAWLKKIVWHEVVNRRRKQARSATGCEVEDPADPASVSELDAAEVVDHNAADDADRFAQLLARLRELLSKHAPENLWATLQVVVKGRTIVDVARELGKSEGAVQNAKDRVLERLRALGAMELCHELEIPLPQRLAVAAAAAAAADRATAGTLSAR